MFSKSCQSKLNLNCNFTFLIGLALNGILVIANVIIIVTGIIISLRTILKSEDH